MVGSRALPLAKNSSTEKRSQLLKRMREPEDEIGLCRIDINGEHVLSKDFNTDTGKEDTNDQNFVTGVGKEDLGGFEKKKVDFISVQVVTECKIIKDKRDLALNNFEEKSSRKTAKKKLVMEEPSNTFQLNKRSPQILVRKEVEEEISAQITTSLKVSKKENTRANISKIGKPKKSFGVSQTVITSSQRKEAEIQSTPNLADLEKKKDVNIVAKQRGSKKLFGKSATMVIECQGSREIIPTEKKELAKNAGKWKERWRRFCWSPIVVTGFKNTSTDISHKTEELTKIKDTTEVKEKVDHTTEESDNGDKQRNINQDLDEIKDDTKLSKEEFQQKHVQVQLQGQEGNFVESQKRAPTMMAPKKRWQSKALGEDFEEKKKREGEKEESSEALKKGWKEKAKDGECYVPPSA